MALARFIRDPGHGALELDVETWAAAEAQGVLPLTVEAAHRANLPVPPQFSARVRAHAAADAVREVELHALFDALESARVPALLFKGAALAYSVYERSDLRPRLDSDVLIDDSDRRAADAVLRRIGYEPVAQFAGELVTYQMPYVRRRAEVRAHLVDLHWRLSNPQQFGAMLTSRELFQASEPLHRLTSGVRGIGLVHALLVACVHPVAHHSGIQPLIWSFDVHLLASRMTPDAWRAFATLSTERGVSAICAHTLREAERCFDSVIPGNVMLRLEAAHVEPSSQFLRRRRHISTVWSDLRALPRWADRLRLVQQHVFPTREYMRHTYAPASAAPLPLLYARRAVRGAWKWLARPQL